MSEVRDQGSEAPVLAEYRRRDFVAFQWDGEKTDYMSPALMETLLVNGLKPGHFIVIENGKPDQPTVYDEAFFRAYFEPVELVAEAPKEVVRVAPEHVDVAGKSLAVELGAISPASEQRDQSYLADAAVVQFLNEIGLADVALMYRAVKGMES